MTKTEVLDYIVDQNDDALFRFKPDYTEVYFQGVNELVLKVDDMTLVIGDDSYSLQDEGDESLKYLINLKLDEVDEILYCNDTYGDNTAPILLGDLVYTLGSLPDNATVRLNIIGFDGTGTCDCPVQVVYDEKNNDLLFSNHWEDPDVLEKNEKRDITPTPYDSALY